MLYWYRKRPDTVAQFNLDEINSTKSLEFADLFLVFNDAFELGNSIRPFLRQVCGILPVFEFYAAV
jgi:hypothetical protein